MSTQLAPVYCVFLLVTAPRLVALARLQRKGLLAFIAEKFSGGLLARSRFFICGQVAEFLDVVLVALISCSNHVLSAAGVNADRSSLSETRVLDV